jgi:hypothetical protein
MAPDKRNPAAGCAVRAPESFKSFPALNGSEIPQNAACFQAWHLTVDDDEKFGEVIGEADLVASFARSIAEASFRQDVIQLRIYRAQFHHHAAELMRLIRSVAPIDGGAT